MTSSALCSHLFPLHWVCADRKRLFSRATHAALIDQNLRESICPARVTRCHRKNRNHLGSYVAPPDLILTGLTSGNQVQLPTLRCNQKKMKRKKKFMFRWLHSSISTPSAGCAVSKHSFSLFSLCHRLLSPVAAALGCARILRAVTVQTPKHLRVRTKGVPV